MELPTTNRQYLAALLALITAFLNNEPEATAPVLGDPLPHPDNNGTKIHPNGAVELPDGTLQFPNSPTGVADPNAAEGATVDHSHDSRTAAPKSYGVGAIVNANGFNVPVTRWIDGSSQIFVTMKEWGDDPTTPIERPDFPLQWNQEGVTLVTPAPDAA